MVLLCALGTEAQNGAVAQSSASSPQTISNNKQGKLVKGTVLDENGDPVIGATVVEVGTTNGSVTDLDGNFKINVRDNAQIEVSYVGYKKLQTKVAFGKTMSLRLSPDTKVLNDVVVIGYGVTTRQNFTGSVSKVDLEKSPVSMTSTSSATELLQGTVPGISFTPSGEAGGSPSMLIRGQKSISNTSTSPLLVVDGVIFDGNINDLDANSIQSMEVLKDASTLAAYGTRAANGVIMITLKKGVTGKPTITFSPSLTVSGLGVQPKMRSPEDYIKLMNLRSGQAEDADPSNWMGQLELANYKAGKTTDWVDFITRTGILQNYTLAISGGTKAMDYYVSGNFWDQIGIYKGNDFRRNTVTFRLNSTINKYLKVGVNANLAFHKFKGVRPQYYRAVRTTPYGEPYLSDGKRLRLFVDGHEQSTQNPLWDVENGIDHTSHRNMEVLGGYLEIKIPHVEGLSFKTNATYTYSNNERAFFQHETNIANMSVDDSGYTQEAYDGHLKEANGYLTTTVRKSWVWDNILTYFRQFGDHFINATLVYTRDEKKYNYRREEGSDFTSAGNTTLGAYGLPYANVHRITNNDYTRQGNIGYLGRINYSYNNTYHLNLSVRRDGSSIFGENKKWGWFPSVGLAWTMTNEKWMKPVTWLNNLKVKFSWGRNGNQSLSPYRTLSPVSLGRGGGYSTYLGNAVNYGEAITALGNASLGWEQTESLNYGFEAQTLNGRLNFEVNMYNSKTTNQIFSRVIPPMGTGLTTQDATMGRIDNWGIEATLTAIPVKTKDFSWTANFVFSLNRNKLKELYGDGKDDITNQLFLGKSLGAIYGYVWDGVVQKGEEHYASNMVATPGDAKYKDLDGDGAITAEDRTILGYNKENFRLSSSQTFTYKNLSLYLLFNGVFSGGKYGKAVNNDAYLTADTYYYHNTLDHPYWTEDNPSNTYPRYSFYDSQRFTALQSYGFVRLQTATLSYQFKGNWMNKIGIAGLRAYITGNNLFCISPSWDGGDPEVRSFDAPQLNRSVSFGFNLKF